MKHTIEKITHKLGYNNHTPILGVWRKPDESCWFWCEYCGKNHKHGTGEGYRVAHCTNDYSPYIVSGYILKDMQAKRAPSGMFKKWSGTLKVPYDV